MTLASQSSFVGALLLIFFKRIVEDRSREPQYRGIGSNHLLDIGLETCHHQENIN